MSQPGKQGDLGAAERQDEAIPQAAWSILLRRADRGLVLVDRKWRIRLSTPAAQRELFRAPAPDHANFWDCAARFFDAATRRRFRRALSHFAPAEAVLAAGEGRWLHVELVCDGELSAILARDATRDLRLQAAARRLQERTRELNESLMLAHRAARAATWEWRTGETLRWTDVEAARDLVGIPRPWSAELVPRDWVELVLPEDRPGLQQAIARVRAEGEGQFVFRVLGADGAVRWLEASGVVAERGPGGEAVRLAGVTIDVTQRRLGEVALQQEVAERRRAEERQRLLVAELNHRVKNTLATVQSIARQTLRSRPELRHLFEDFEGRLLALSWAHDVLNAEGWSGAELPSLVERTLRAHQGSHGTRIVTEGPSVRLAPEIALAISLALHELATNALKYGAFARDDGVVEIRWRLEHAAPQEQPELVMEWRERNGPAVVVPTRTGFGTRLLRQALAAELGAPVDLRFEPEGLVCRLSTRRGLLASADDRGQRPPLDPRAPA